MTCLKMMLLGDRDIIELLLSSLCFLSVCERHPTDDDVPPGVSPLSDSDSSQPSLELQAGQKQTVWFSFQSPLGLHVPSDGNQNSPLGCNKPDLNHWSRTLI